MSGELLVRKQRTPSLRGGELERKWVLVDADGLVLGRLASRVAVLLRGKHKPTYTPHMDCGDGVIVINASRIALTSNKWLSKVYWRHTGYPGGIKSERAMDIRDGCSPDRLLRLAVARMLSKGPLMRQQLKSLRIYSGPDHPHDGVKPEAWDVAALNPKNVLRSERRGAGVVRRVGESG